MNDTTSIGIKQESHKMTNNNFLGEVSEGYTTNTCVTNCSLIEDICMVWLYRQIIAVINLVAEICTRGGGGRIIILANSAIIWWRKGDCFKIVRQTFGDRGDQLANKPFSITTLLHTVQWQHATQWATPNCFNQTKCSRQAVYWRLFGGQMVNPANTPFPTATCHTLQWLKAELFSWESCHTSITTRHTVIKTELFSWESCLNAQNRANSV